MASASYESREVWLGRYCTPKQLRKFHRLPFPKLTWKVFSLGNISEKRQCKNSLEINFVNVKLICSYFRAIFSSKRAVKSWLIVFDYATTSLEVQG